MARKRSSSKQNSSDNLIRELISALLFSFGLFSALSLIFYSSSSDLDVKGAMGTIGVFISDMLGKAFGVCAFVVPVVMFYSSVVVFLNRAGTGLYRKALASFIFLLATMTLLGLAYVGTDFLGYNPAGGWIGNTVAEVLRDGLAGTVGSYLIVTILLLASLIIISSLTLTELIGVTGKISKSIMENIYAGSKFLVLKGKDAAIHLKESYSKAEIKAEGEPLISEGNGSTALYGKQSPVDDILNEEIITLEDEIITQGNPETIEADGDQPQIVVEHPKLQGLEKFFPKKEILHNDYELPSTDLLDPKMESNLEVDRNAVYEKAKLIEDKLKDFGVSGKITEIRPGPVITMFEYKPAPGIKINKISSLENDLAMGLSAFSIRIIAPIPGKDVIGIEVPNAKREVVVLRELLEDPEFSKSESMLTLALGKDISGLPFYMDLRKAPHLMIAGTTGSGKSVLLNAVITSMLYKASPYELKFIMIDPKMLELSVYEDIPHLLHPVVTEPKKAAAALRWAVQEMDNRYRILSEEGVRDIETHNRNIARLNREDKWEKLLPYIVIVLDELADLMMTAPNEIKESITRLSQKARAAGIHLIVATQRPSADIVAGLIKANFPARISFLVSSKIDSRIILDAGGAERLLGKGDMLFLEPGTSKLLRLQGALISDEEREGITEFVKSQGQPQYNEDITHVEEREGLDELEDDKDELYHQALRTIAETGQASISMLQRKLKIGYNRAARIVEIMEKEGVVGPQEVAGKPREVFIDPSQVEERQ
ncbi:MAG: DNA translocase FtsK [Candidatus Dadabacteria bacterium]|nr:MAG: DNA translocase FtsK [Candidatus Dadabacteria bacterium]